MKTLVKALTLLKERPLGADGSHHQLNQLKLAKKQNITYPKFSLLLDLTCLHSRGKIISPSTSKTNTLFQILF
jgi:hypothetical protein